MTALNTLVTDDAAHLVTDGRMTDTATGALVAIQDKVQEAPTLKTAFAVNGGAWVGPYLAQDVSQRPYATYSDLVRGVASNLHDTIREVHEQVPGAPRHWGEFAVVFVGWENGPRSDLLHVVDNGPGRPTINHHPALAYRSFNTGKILHEDDIEGTAVELLESQRIPDGDGGPLIATGFVQLTTVTSDGIKKKVLKRWPDVVGERAG